MVINTALLILCFIVGSTFSAVVTCKHTIECPCGSTGKNIRVCVQDSSRHHCEKWSRCKDCDGKLDHCSLCPDGFEGPFCTRRGRAGSCDVPLNSPISGGITCFPRYQEMTCVGRCLPGYHFMGYESQEEITAHCRGGVWTSAEFPACYSVGDCDLIVEAGGSFNCTTTMDGTFCDVSCNMRSLGRFFCYPGQPWKPSLPHCVKPKEENEEIGKICSCQYGASCDSMGNCMCPTGRTGAFCESEIEEIGKICSCQYGARCDSMGNCMCPTGRTGAFCESESSKLKYCENPGPISSGKVLHVPSLNERSRPAVDNDKYPSGSRLRYTCNDGYSLKGVAALTCEAAGFWSNSPPECIKDSTHGRYCSPTPISNGEFFPVIAPNERNRPVEESEMYFPGSRLRYRCSNGYTLRGTDTIVCDADGVWSADPPMCVLGRNNGPASCVNPGPIMNGRITYVAPGVRRQNRPVTTLEEDLPKYPTGTRLEYFCDEGFQLEGADTATCQSSGSWSVDAPACVVECGRSFMQTTGRVVHGNQLISGEWPWVVSISSPEYDDVFCGGALLNSRTVITAAHCLGHYNSFILRFGKHYRNIKDDDEEVLVRKSKRVIIHENFNNSIYDSDIGLVIFEPRIRPSIRLQPICLPTLDSTKENLVTGTIGNIAGWGKTEKDLPADELLLIRLPVQTNEVCIESYQRQNLPFTITKNMFCAGYENGQESVCEGDSGSGVVFLRRINGEVYVGRTREFRSERAMWHARKISSIHQSVSFSTMDFKKLAIIKTY